MCVIMACITMVSFHIIIKLCNRNKYHNAYSIVLIYIAPGMVERNDGQKKIGTLCTKEGQREKERQRKERKRQKEKEIEPMHCSAHIGIHPPHYTCNIQNVFNNQQNTCGDMKFQLHVKVRFQ